MEATHGYAPCGHVAVGVTHVRARLGGRAGGTRACGCSACALFREVRQGRAAEMQRCYYCTHIYGRRAGRLLGRHLDAAL
eukprot:scaffold422_cov399-Prasinococcus_capsulatus_cf.AAC.8